MKMKKLTTIALAAALAIGTFGFSVPAKASEMPTTTTDYTLTIPATLTVTQSGWNATDGIKAQVKEGDAEFDSGKKLTVTAESTNSWALKSGQITIGYNLATATGTYSSTATPASWEFSATELDASGGTNKAMGIIVDDYSNKPAGSYTDTVTFTAKVGNASALSAALVNGATLEVVAAIYDEENYAAGGNFTYNNGVFELNRTVAGGSMDDFVYAEAALSDDGTTITFTTGWRGADYATHITTFDLTNDTYSTTGGSWKGYLFYVQVNGVEITNKLTPAPVN